ncbi:hypothetical protein NK211_13675 [Mammaliicoccus sciuri]|uniref:putative immunity protein n=1 Tax=Mammaliicoccus sciuri TaxID=1296 RepID=UPI0020A1358D|nr:hypothetical protein [Mammaliicoccus sciuri]MCP1288429.1 hypothetical protein [Mammaliicoccus sciuri]
MDIEEYAWNEHERELKKAHKVEIPSKYKVKIQDDIEKRITLETLLEELTQKELVEWAITNAKRFIDDIDIGNDENKHTIISENEHKLQLRKEGQMSVYELRQAGFLANKLSQRSITEQSKFAARVCAQAIATGHMRGHAIVSSDYAIKVMNIISNNDLKLVTEERNKQIHIAKDIMANR